MQLGIVVVYQAIREDEELLKIHLNQIDRCTDVPYRIYATANRSIPEIRALLADRPRVRICNCPSTDLRGKEEHSFYLEELVKTAVEDGVTHIDLDPINGPNGAIVQYEVCVLGDFSPQICFSRSYTIWEQ